MTNELKAGDMVTYNGMAVKLTSFVNDIAGYHYWWSETLFTQEPETTMMAFPHGADIKNLHTRSAYGTQT